MGLTVVFSPNVINFGAVHPGESGPDISVFSPEFTSFAGGVQLKSSPTDTRVTAAVLAGSPVFKVRDVIALEEQTVPVDCSELPHGCGGHRPPTTTELVRVAESDGSTPLGIKRGQTLLVRVVYTAPSGDASSTGTLSIKGEGWDPVEIPLSLSTAQVKTDFPVSLSIVQGQVATVPITVRSIAGPDTAVTYEISRTQLHTGLKIVPSDIFVHSHEVRPAFLTFQADGDAPLGFNAVAIDQVAFGRIGTFVQVNILAAPPVDALAIATQKINDKYAQLGGRRSPLGRPILPGAPVQSSGNRFFTNYRGGQITFSVEEGVVAHQTFETIVRYRGIHCFGKSEAVDEPYAIVGVYTPDSPDTVIVKKFPKDRTSYENFVSSTDESASDDVRTFATPQDIAISCTVMEHDSGDPDRAAAAVEGALKKAAGDSGVASAGDISVFTGILDDLGIPGLIADVLGVGDDVIGVQTLQIHFTELEPGPPLRKFQQVSFNFESPLLTDGDASYKIYFEVFTSRKDPETRL